MPENEIVVEVAEERAWAVDMTQSEFNFEYERRHPNTDVIPDLNMYLHPPVQEDRSMTPMNPEEYEEDGPAGHVPEVAVNPDAEFTCPGCGFLAKKKFFKNGTPMLIGIKAHMRKCKVKLDKDEEVIKDGYNTSNNA